MKATELIAALEALVTEHGDLEIVADNYDYGSAPQLCDAVSLQWFERQAYTDETWSYGDLHPGPGERRKPVIALHPCRN